MLGDELPRLVIGVGEDLERAFVGEKGICGDGKLGQVDAAAVLDDSMWRHSRMKVMDSRTTRQDVYVYGDGSLRVHLTTGREGLI